MGHFTASLASNSPVTDGERVYAFFGSRGLYCFDVDGKPQWEKDLGEMQTKHGHGEGSSPALYGDTLIVNWDHEGQSFVAAFDKRNGKQRWKAAREEVTSWATPIVVEHAGKPQVVISGTHRVRGYDLATGAVIWECGGLSANIVASPVAGGWDSFRRQQLRQTRTAGNPIRRCEGQHHWNRPGSVAAQAWHTVRTVSPAIWRLVVFPAPLPRDTVACGYEDR